MKKKKGSAMIFVILIIVVLFTLSAGLMEIALSSLRQSANYKNKNEAFYYTDAATNIIINYMNAVGNAAKNSVNEYCFTPLGEPNLEDERIKAAYETDNFEALMKIIFHDYYVDKLTKYLNNEIALPIKTGTMELPSDLKWEDIKAKINEDIGKMTSSGVNITYQFYSDSDNSLFQSIKDHSRLFYESDKGLVDSLIVKTSLNSKKVERMLFTNFTFTPFKENTENISKNIEKKGYNPLLDYCILSGKNLLIINGDNTASISGDIYVRGSGNRLSENAPYNKYGGIIAGINENTLDGLKESSVNKSEFNLSDNISGNLIVNGMAVVGGIEEKEGIIDGEDKDRYYLNSGYIRTSAPNSKITVEKDTYCNSVVTDEEAYNSSLNFDENVYISDNVSLYAENQNNNSNSVYIKKDLISFEQSNDDTNFNNSSSIVVNDDSAKLKIDGKVYLFGTAFIDELKNSDNRIFKTFETTAITPNFNIYTYKMDGFNYRDYYLDINNKEDEFSKISMFDVWDTLNKIGNRAEVINNSKNYVDTYLNNHINKPDEFDFEINKSQIELNKADSSYYPFLFIANNNLYLEPNNSIKDTASLTADAKKTEIIKKIKFEDKGLKSQISGIGDERFNFLKYYLDFDCLNGDIKLINKDKKIYIRLSNDNIDINLNKENVDVKDYNLDGYKVLIAGSKNITIDSDKDTKIYGNIISLGDIILKGKNITLEWDKEISKEIMNYYDYNRSDDCLKLYQFFSKGIMLQDLYTKEVYSGYPKTTDILINTRRQIIKK
ncbi:pilus assembly PilX N-terminal domain-containing protein [Caloramator quimbayensis]|uniref:pilus assembly PilX N-terminal domain-containing protein n=1 Tax=Caloramator quimbayensis TaxID=1147123 RepID=UPI001178C1D7|nr:pilus assembly PilX N-terminal domain-containing protein [Caloramator quimbayensis]